MVGRKCGHIPIQKHCKLIIFWILDDRKRSAGSRYEGDRTCKAIQGALVSAGTTLVEMGIEQRNAGEPVATPQTGFSPLPPMPSKSVPATLVEPLGLEEPLSAICGARTAHRSGAIRTSGAIW